MYIFTFAADHADRLLNAVTGPPLEPVAERAKRLHARLVVADLHCDALLWGRDLLERADHGHADVPRLTDGNVALQVFSVVTRVPLGMNYERNTGSPDVVALLALLRRWPRPTWSSTKERALYLAQTFHEAVARSKGRLTWVGSADDLREHLVQREKESDVVAGILAIEGLHGLESDVRNVDVFFDAGFRMMAPVHFFDNEMGGSAHGVAKGGLTIFGRRVIERMEALGIIVDLSHASPELFDDVVAIAKRPVVASHTGVKGTCNNVRNLSDEQIVGVASTDGVIGVGFWKGAVCDTDPAAIVRAIRYVRDLVGIDHVALGSDFDGATRTAFDTAGLAQITNALLNDGFTEEDIHRIMGGNVVRLFLEGLPSTRRRES